LCNIKIHLYCCSEIIKNITVVYGDHPVRSEQVVTLCFISIFDSALISSLQRDVSAREKQALKLAAEVDKLRQDVRHKEAKLTSMMDKVPASALMF